MTLFLSQTDELGPGFLAILMIIPDLGRHGKFQSLKNNLKVIVQLTDL